LAILLKVVGLFLAIGGITAAGLGWPYRMIDWGNIQVVLGGLAFVGGIILAALGAVISEIRRLADKIGNHAPAVQEDDAAESEIAPPIVVEPSLPSPLAADTASRTGDRTAMLAGAAAAVTGAAVIAASRSANADEAADTVRPTADVTVGVEPERPAQDGIAAMPELAEDMSSDARMELGEGERVEPEFARVETDVEQTLSPLADDGFVWIKPEDAPPGLSLDALTARINEAAGDLTALRRGVTEAGTEVMPEPKTKSWDEADAGAAQPAAETPAVAHEHRDVVDPDVTDGEVQMPDLTLANDIAQDRGAVDTPDDDTVSAGEVFPSLGENEPTISAALTAVEDAVEHIVESDDSREPVTPSEMDAMTSAVSADESGQTVIDEAEPSAASATDETESDDEAREAVSSTPAANAEGVVSVHRIGDATYTMFADGTIRAETPEGAFGFSTVAELKAYLAGDKSVARPLA
jgi:hypothetical protein